jgi:hypothetical protein
LRTCLTDDSLPLDVRAGGALVLLFGLPGERLSQLRADHLDQREDDTYLRLGKAPVPIPPRLADLLRRLARQPRTNALLTNSNPGPRHLFPGMLPGRAIVASVFNSRLARHGIRFGQPATRPLQAWPPTYPLRS